MLKINGLVASGSVFLSLSLSATADAGVYQCKDENGNQLFTQRKVHCADPGSADKYGPKSIKSGVASRLDQSTYARPASSGNLQSTGNSVGSGFSSGSQDNTLYRYGYAGRIINTGNHGF